MITEQVKDDWRKAKLPKADHAMLEYAEKLSIAPSMMTEDDITKLRDVGWTDRDILDIAHVCAYFNFRVRMVDGLGLELGDWQLERSKAGADRAQALAHQRGEAMPADPWGVRDG